MVLNRVIHAFSFCTLMGLLLGPFTITIASDDDVLCLKSIKDSLEDPDNHLRWDFRNETQGLICLFNGVSCWNDAENRVLNIELSHMGLKGQFPRGIENCKALTGLNLSGNQLLGPIPSDIGKRLPYITALDLSFNNFSGEIPPSISNCTYLVDLRLNHNQLVGHIPQQLALLGRLKALNVAHNLLSGPVPNFVDGSVTRDSFANNKGLCGTTLMRCPIDDRRKIGKFEDSFKSGFVIGFAFWATTIVVLCTSWTSWVYGGKRNKNNITVAEIIKLMIPLINKKRTEDDQEHSNLSAKLLQEGTEEIESIFTQAYSGEARRTSYNLISVLEKAVTRMSFADLSNATENFSESNIIGLGLMGTMYKATLPNGWLLAVKRMHDSRRFEEHIVSELKTLGRFRHNNLLPLLGFCIESSERLMVYKYISNGNLFDWLHSMDDRKRILEWHLRMKIAVGVARGLAWLHHGCKARIVHLDISSKCILLDRKFEPKLSNFGEATLMSSNNTSRANNEFWEMAFVKEDVHNFGVVLLELITGVDSSRMTDSSNSILNEWIGHILNSSNMYDAIDKSLVGQGYDAEIFQLLKLACSCVDPIPDRRPTMLQVYKNIKLIRERDGLIDDPEIPMQHEISPTCPRDKTTEVEIVESQS